MDSLQARQTWELENRIEPLASADVDAIYRYDERIHADVLSQKPWTKDPHFFKNVRISALALLKMVVHARSGDTIEVMGIMQGKVVDGTIIVMDAFALPVEGTETRVNAQAEAYEYMVEFTQTNKRAGRLENVVGWYHSHPGYGCWLSGIDVSTQMLNQEFQEPFLAVVIDPTRTVSAGKVEIGAFRTYPKGYKPPDEPPSEYQTIPLNKIEDFGVHCKQYYSLDITYFKSSLDSHLLDLLWNKYWVNTLSSSQLLQSIFLSCHPSSLPLLHPPSLSVLLPRHHILQVVPRLTPAGPAVEQVLGQHALLLATSTLSFSTIPHPPSLFPAQYYSLDITYFKSSLDSHLLDLLWNKYWVNTLSSSQLLANRDYVAGQISDLGTSWAGLPESVLCTTWVGVLYALSTQVLGQHALLLTAPRQPKLPEKLEQAEGQLAHWGSLAVNVCSFPLFPPSVSHPLPSFPPIHSGEAGAGRGAAGAFRAHRGVPDAATATQGGE
ncbi:unnamed protein product [Closterium sp. Yama58-4]|nr:unnamed protein product [Closterium sp. Yama58-4]